jgi:hypothetical protein
MSLVTSLASHSVIRGEHSSLANSLHGSIAFFDFSEAHLSKISRSARISN